MRLNKPSIFRLAVSCLSGLLMACSGGALQWQQDEYVVREGDTLYAIAWRHDLDYREVAKWNRINPQAVLLPGQRLALHPGARVSAESKTASSAPAKPAYKYIPPPDAGDVQWRWPVLGVVVSRYDISSTSRKGIGISGKAGDPVAAAAGGEVVYAGDALIGYGHVVIVKHNATWLSAYGYNRGISVKEGDMVKAGQRIATMGGKAAGNGQTQPQLHFEIRKNGQPVNPLKYLPSR